MELSFTLRNVLAGSVLLGGVGGVVGCFAVLRRQSLLGDALAHAALPGVCLGYLVTGTKAPLPLFLGALVAGLAGALTMIVVTRTSRIKEDSAIGLVLSVFFGAGIVLLTWIQRLPMGNQSGLDSFLFGQAATLVEADVRLMAILSTAVLLVVALLFKELKVLAFDPDFGAATGLPMRRLEVLLTTLLVVVVVVGLQTVGVILIVAALIMPAAAARQWTERLGVMLGIAALFGAAAGAAGAVASATVDRLPTGPAIVLVASGILGVSIVLAPNRGLLWAWLRTRQVTRRIRQENLLKDLWLVAERSDTSPRADVALPTLMGLRGQSAHQLRRSARPLLRRGLLTKGDDGLRLSDRGLAAAEQVVRKHRLWEVYLTRRLELASTRVHRDAEAMEHVLSSDAVDALDRRLGHPEEDPHGRRIPGKAGLVSPELVILLVGAQVGAACALVGTFLVLRRMALMGDAISHAVLPGIALAFLLTGTRATLAMVVGAGLLGVLTVFLVELLNRSGRLKEDASIGVVFPALFALGVIMISRWASQVDLDLDCVLYGEIAYAPWDVWLVGDTSLGPKALWSTGSVLLLDLALVLAFYKELKLVTFDAGLAATLGFAPTLVHYLLMTSVSITVVGAFESVGAILVVAMLIVPPATAYLLTDRLVVMLGLAVLLGMASSTLGYLGARWLDCSIAGAMAVVAGLLFLLAFVFSPSHGFLTRWLRHRRLGVRLAGQLVMLHLRDSGPPLPVEKLEERFGWQRRQLRQAVREALDEGWIEVESGGLRLTAAGAARLEDTGQAQLAHRVEGTATV